MSSVDGLSGSELDFIGTQISSLLSKTEKLMDSILLLRNFYEQSELACRVISNRLIKHIFTASNAVLASIAYAQGLQLLIMILLLNCDVFCFDTYQHISYCF